MTGNSARRAVENYLFLCAQGQSPAWDFISQGISAGWYSQATN